jgi:hypothetical protein
MAVSWKSSTSLIPGGVSHTFAPLLSLRDPVSPQIGSLGGSLGGDQSLLLPPEAGLNLNLGSYQSDELGSQVGSQAFPGSFM